jgi:hypothetical protein
MSQITPRIAPLNPPYPPEIDAQFHRSTLGDEEFAALAAHYDDAKILEIMLLCGFYRTVSYLANSLMLPLEERAARFPGV